jgi:hypothetical protein
MYIDGVSGVKNPPKNLKKDSSTLKNMVTLADQHS